MKARLLALLLPIVLLAAGLIGRGCQTSQPATDNHADATRLAPTVILISLDGFRPDYVDRYEAPVLRRLAAEGVRAEGMLPTFPSKMSRCRRFKAGRSVVAPLSLSRYHFTCLIP